MKNFKNTKTLFLISFFGCFIMPVGIAIFAALSVFFDIAGPVSNWVLVDGGIWILAIYQILIILITVMLWLTLKLKDVEKITTDDVVKGTKSNSKVKKINIIKIPGLGKSKRKDVKVPEKRNIFNDVPVNNTKVAPVVKKVTPTTSPATNKRMFSAIKK